MVIKTPCDIGDTVIINGKKYTCGGFIIGSSGANVNLFDEKHKLFQPNFEQVEAALRDKAKGFSTVEQKHGHWKDLNDCDEIYGDLYECPFCGNVIVTCGLDGKPDNYCGNCGAKMYEEAAALE